MNIFRWFRDYTHWIGLLVFEAGLDLETYLRPRVRREFRRLQHAVAMALGFPALLIVIGAAAGGWSDAAKGWIIGIGFFALSIQVLILAWRRAIIGSTLGVLFEGVTRGMGGRNPRQLAVDGVKGYVNVVMYILFTEGAVGILAIALPLHENPRWAFLTALAAIGYVAYTIYDRGRSSWPKVAGFILLCAMIIGLVMVLVPPVGDLIRNTRQDVIDATRRAATGKSQPGTLSATPHPGLRRIEVPLRPGGEETPVGHLIRGGWCYAVRRGDAKNLRLKFADGAVEPFGGRYHGWRELEALLADSGTAAIEIYRPNAGSCRPEDAA